MAKRKAAKATRKSAATRAGTGRRRASAVKKKAASRTATKRTAKPAAPAGRARSGASTRKTTARTAASRKATAKATKSARNAKTAKAARAGKTTKSAKTARTTTAKAKAPASSARPRSAPPAKSRQPATPVRKSPALNRVRRVVTDEDEDIVHASPPSSLDLNRTASSARSGRRTLSARHREHTETSPALTGGDVDADWESAYSVGDEAPGGDNPTPDQDIVDDIGKAVGIEYQDNEPLKGADKVEERDRKRWELDPASSEYWEDR